MKYFKILVSTVYLLFADIRSILYATHPMYHNSAAMISFMMRVLPSTSDLYKQDRQYGIPMICLLRHCAIRNVAIKRILLSEGVHLDRLPVGTSRHLVQAACVCITSLSLVLFFGARDFEESSFSLTCAYRAGNRETISLLMSIHNYTSRTIHCLRNECRDPRYNMDSLGMWGMLYSFRKRRRYPVLGLYSPLYSRQV